MEIFVGIRYYRQKIRWQYINLLLAQLVSITCHLFSLAYLKALQNCTERGHCQPSTQKHKHITILKPQNRIAYSQRPFSTSKPKNITAQVIFSLKTHINVFRKTVLNIEQANISTMVICSCKTHKHIHNHDFQPQNTTLSTYKQL